MHLEAEGVRGGAREPQLAERNAELGGPALGVARNGDVPHRVPRVVFFGVVEDVGVALHAGRVDLEDEPGAPVVIRVDADGNPVRRRPGVAARELRGDAARLAVERAHADVDGVVGVGDAHLGALARGLAFVRIPLGELAHHGRGGPHGLVQLPPPFATTCVWANAGTAAPAQAQTSTAAATDRLIGTAPEERVRPGKSGLRQT